MDGHGFFKKYNLPYWDGNDTTANADGDGGTGIWNTSTNWATAARAGGDTTWNNATLDIAIFGGTASNSVALGSNIHVGGLQFNTTGYGITTTGQALNFAAANNTILFNGIADASITGPVGGSGNVILSRTNISTVGTLSLAGTTTGGWSGTVINAGMIQVYENAAAFSTRTSLLSPCRTLTTTSPARSLPVAALTVASASPASAMPPAQEARVPCPCPLR